MADEIPLEDELDELPQPAPAARSWPRPWQPAFLAALSVLPDITAACRHAGVSRNTAYRWRNRDDDQGRRFLSAWEEALSLAIDYLQRRAWEWATNGVEVVETRTTVKKDKEGNVLETTEVTTERRERSATMAIFMLKAWNAERYRWTERWEGSGPDGGPLQISNLGEIDRRIAELTAEINTRAAAAGDVDVPSE